MAFGYELQSLRFDSTQDLVTEVLKEYFIWPLIAVVYLIIGLVEPAVISIDVIRQILLSSIDLILLAVAITFVLAAAEIDLSLVGTMGVAPLITTWFITQLGVPAVLAVVIVLPAVSILIGLLNTFLVNRLEIDSLIATLGTYFFLVGLLFMFTRGKTISGFGSAYTYIGNATVAGVDLIIVAMAALAVVAHFILSKHPFGQDLLLTGGDEDSAVRAGIKTDKVRRNSFILCALFAAAAGFLLSSRLAIISSTFGQGRLLFAIAAPILGGIRLTGGKASIHQAVGGAFLLQMINTTMTLAGINGYYIRLYTGILIIIAIVIGGLRMYRVT